MSVKTMSQGERRKELPRSRTLLTGKIVFDNCARSIDCTIRDKTKVGARIKLASIEPVPSRLYLIDIKAGTAIESDVSWTRPPELGLTFVETHSLDEDVKNPLMKGLRRIWLELAAR